MIFQNVLIERRRGPVGILNFYISTPPIIFVQFLVPMHCVCVWMRQSGRQTESGKETVPVNMNGTALGRRCHGCC